MPRWCARLLVLAALVITACVATQAAHSTAAHAHPLSTSAVLLTVESDRVTGQVQMPLDRLAIAVDRPLTAEYMTDPAAVADMRDYLAAHMSATYTPTTNNPTTSATPPAATDQPSWSTTVDNGRLEMIDGVEHLVFDVTMTPPAGMGQFQLNYDAIVERLVSHKIFVSSRAASEAGAVGEPAAEYTAEYTVDGIVDWESQSVVVSSTANSGPGKSTAGVFGSSIHLGVEHISEGADHLLFLVMLLLPAPLVAVGGRWVRSNNRRRSCIRIVHVVTAFAVGHSITLALAAFGYLDLSTRLVESAIALSILVSGAHAIRPFVKGGEVWIAAVFGLMHGIAFATLLADLHTTSGSLLVELVGFNLGIELTQLLVVALVMPSLLLLATTRAYTPFRISVATVGMVLAAAWLLERLGFVAASPFDGVTDAMIEHPILLAGALFAAAVVVRLIDRRSKTPPTPEEKTVATSLAQ